MAAEGMTNREIAVAPETVEVHLGNAYRKLDVSSRRHLPEVLARATVGADPSAAAAFVAVEHRRAVVRALNPA